MYMSDSDCDVDLDSDDDDHDDESNVSDFSNTQPSDVTVMVPLAKSIAGAAQASGQILAFHLHKSILSAACSYYRTVFTNDPSTSRIIMALSFVHHDMQNGPVSYICAERQSVIQFFNKMYHSEALPEIAVPAWNLLLMSHYCSFSSLTLRCEKCLISDPCAPEDTASLLDDLVWAQYFHLNQLKTHLIKRLRHKKKQDWKTFFTGPRKRLLQLSHKPHLIKIMQQLTK